MTHDPIYPALITEVLKTVRYPGNGKNLVEKEIAACKSTGMYRHNEHSLVEVLVVT